MKSPHIFEVKVLMKLEKEADDSYVVTCPQLGCIFVHEASEEAGNLDASGNRWTRQRRD